MPYNPKYEEQPIHRKQNTSVYQQLHKNCNVRIVTTFARHKHDRNETETESVTHYESPVTASASM